MRGKLGGGLAASQGSPSTVSEGVPSVLLVQGQPEADLKGRENSLEMNSKSPGDLLHNSHGHIPVPGKNGTETPSTVSVPAKPVTRLIALSSLEFLWLLQLQKETGAWLLGDPFARGGPMTSGCERYPGCGSHSVPWAQQDMLPCSLVSQRCRDVAPVQPL